MRLLSLAAIVVAALLSSAGPASALGKRCGSCTDAPDRGGPLRNLIGGVVDRIQDRRAARGCQAVEAAPSAGDAPAYHALPAGGASCANGVCYPAPTGRR